MEFQTKLVTNYDKGGDKGWTSDTGNASGSKTITEDATVVASGSHTRWFRVRSRGPHGASDWKYGHRVYSTPYIPKNVTGTVTAKSGGMQVKAHWTQTKNNSYPVDSQTAEYAIKVPAAGLTYNGNADGTIGTVAGEGGAASAFISRTLELDECLFKKYDEQEETMKQFKSTDDAIDSLIATAEAEEGYLEKRSNASLDNKTGNAGSKNYTKYWRDIKPAWQGESWCACFVSWCFMVVFGQAAAALLLKHWPFLYCPTLASKTSNKTPKRGAVILFWRSAKKRYGHTGIVYKVTDDYIYTIEGNTSAGEAVISNGGGVCKKKYKRANLDARTLYFMPDYRLVCGKEEKNLIPGECKVTLKQFLVGAEHEQVKTIQILLNVKGYKGKNGKVLTVDGRLGENTAYAIATFQKAEKLDIKSPGTVGNKTWSALLM